MSSKKYDGLNISIDTTAIQKLSKELNKLGDNAPTVISKALNRTIDNVKTNTKKAVAGRYTIKVKDVDSTFKTSKATANDTRAVLTTKGYRLSMAHFKFSPSKSTQPSSSNSRTKSGKLKKLPTTKVKVLKGSLVQSSKKTFVARTTKNPTNETKYPLNVFVRFKEGSRAIAVRRSLSVPQMVQSRKLLPKIEEEAAKTLEKRLNHEIQREMDRIKV